MYSATMSAEVRTICKKFMRNPFEIYIDNDTKLTLHGLQQYIVKLNEEQKIQKLFDLLDALLFNQVIIFVKSFKRAETLSKVLVESSFPSTFIHGALT